MGRNDGELASDVVDDRRSGELDAVDRRSIDDHFRLDVSRQFKAMCSNHPCVQIAGISGARTRARAPTLRMESLFACVRLDFRARSAKVRPFSSSRSFLVCSVREGCADSPCQNGGLCSSVNQTDYECECLSLFNGTNCEGDKRKSIATVHLFRNRPLQRQSLPQRNVCGLGRRRVHV